MAEFAGYAGLSSVIQYDMFYDCQAQARPVFARGLVGEEKRFWAVRSDAGAGVADRHLDVR